MSCKYIDMKGSQEMVSEVFGIRCLILNYLWQLLFNFNQL